MAKQDYFPVPYEMAVSKAEILFQRAARARAEAENAEAYLKQVKALRVVKYRDAGCGIGEAQERAVASPEYNEARNDWAKKNIEWRVLEGDAKGTELRFETWRTASATERAKMQLR